MIADAAAELESKLEIVERGKKGGRGHKKLSDRVADNLPKKDTRAKAAKRAKVSERKLKKARTVRKARPDLAAKVEAGELTLAAALREAKLSECRLVAKSPPGWGF